MSYIDSNASEINDIMDNATLKKTQTKTYVLEQLPKVPSFVDIFYRINGFGGASTPSKFPEIIRSSFTSEKSLKKARDLAVSEKILVNNNVKQNLFTKFSKIVSIKMQLIGLWQKALIEFKFSEIANLVAAEWSILMEKNSIHVAKAKICFIGHNLAMYVHDKCAVICFGNETSKLAAIGFLPVFKSVNLYWAGLFLACCVKCKQYDHVVTPQDQVCLANIYKKKQAPITHPVSFGGLFWAKVVGGFSFSLLSVRKVLANVGFFSEMKPSLPVVNGINNRFAALECSLASLAEQVDKLAKSESLGASAGGVAVVEVVSFDMSSVLKLKDSMKCLIEMVLGLSAKVDSLSTDLLKGKICPWIANKFSGVRVFILDLNSGYLGLGVAIVMNNSLTKHVYKVSKFDVKNANEVTWNEFKDAMAANVAMFSDGFAISKRYLDLDAVTGGFWSLFLNVVNVCLL
ncbi:hypothetical protein G9A89_019486 [Geosiphon pyriformis]|nr:hypothetical protein G9A89_019486 [Geosiphon pyriformis]